MHNKALAIQTLSKGLTKTELGFGFGRTEIARICTKLLKAASASFFPSLHPVPQTANKAKTKITTEKVPETEHTWNSGPKTGQG